MIAWQNSLGSQDKLSELTDVVKNLEKLISFLYFPFYIFIEPNTQGDLINDFVVAFMVFGTWDAVYEGRFIYPPKVLDYGDLRLSNGVRLGSFQ